MKTPNKRLFNHRQFSLERLEDRYMLAATAPVASGVQADTFLLHSLPGYNSRSDVKTIYLDFTGKNTSGTRYNTDFNSPTIFTPAFDVDGDPTNFNGEWQIIQSVWEEVSELLRPFDIDVTTQDPTTSDPGALFNSGGGDAAWGIRVLIGGSQNDWFTPNGGGNFVGFAYSSSFNSPTSELPAFVFSDQALQPDPATTAKAIGLAATYEIGISLGVRTDGQNRFYVNIQNGKQETEHDTYFVGQALTADTSTFDPIGNPYWSPAASWGSIMGVVNPFITLSQWNKGEYYNADNAQDDLATITSAANGVNYRTDDHANSADTTTSADALATPDPNAPQTFDDLSGDGVIEQNTDKDYFSFTIEGLGGTVDLNVNPFVNFATYAGPESLDIRANLYSSDGTLIATSNPWSDLSAGSGTWQDTFYTTDPTTGVASPTTPDPTGGWQVQLDTTAHTPTYTDPTTGDIFGVVSLHPVGDLNDQNNLSNTKISQLILPAGNYYVEIEGGSRPLTYLDGTDEPWLMAQLDPMLSTKRLIPLPDSSIHPGPLKRYVDDQGNPGYYEEMPDPNDPTKMIEVFVPTDLPQDNSDYGYSNYGSLGYYSISGKVSKNLVVGVDFDVPGGASPTNWNQFTGGPNGTVLSDLLSETGASVPYTLTVSTTGSDFNSVATTGSIDPSELPSHANPLDDVSGYLATTTDTLTFTWGNLAPGTVYQIYVIGHSSDASENQVTVTGGEWNGVQQTYSFTQFITPNGLVVNNNAPGSQDLSTYQLNVIADDTGHITITVSGADGAPAGIAGLAISPTKIGSITGQKFEDDNGNGVHDTGEPGLPGWVVYLDTNGDGQLNSTSDQDILVAAPNVPQPITDGNGDLGGSTTKNQLEFTDSGTILDLDVTINITHQYDADLRIWLVSPTGTTVQLVANVGVNKQNFTNTTFDDDATIGIAQGVAPYTGSYRPQEPLSAFNGENAQGTWTLLVLDDVSGFTGVLNSWSITVKTAGSFLEPYAVTDANGNYSFSNLPPGQYLVREHFSDEQKAAGWTQTMAPTPVDLRSGSDLTGIDFGNWIPASKPGSISGQIFTDLDGDGVKDDNEPGLSGWKAYIDANNNGVRDVPNAPTVINSTDIPKTITDFSTVNSQVEFNGLGTVFNITVTLDITHSFVGDLDAYLIGPTGRQVELFTGVGGQFNDFHNLTLDDSAARSIATIGEDDQPYSGTWQPEGHLSDFNNTDAEGTWTLQIRDTQKFDEGILNSWSLSITAGEEFRTTDDDGNYTFENLPPADYKVREEAPQGWTQIPPAATNIPAASWSGGTWLVSVVGLDDINDPNGPDARRNVKNVNFGNQSAQPLAGDYNRSNGVSAADYVLWRSQLGTTGAAFAGADGNGDGVVNAADYNVWRSNFGSVAQGFGDNAASENVLSSLPPTEQGTIEAVADVHSSAFPAKDSVVYDVSTTLGTQSATSSAGMAFGSLATTDSGSSGSKMLSTSLAAESQNSSDAALLAWIASQPATSGSVTAETSFHATGDSGADGDLADSIDSVFDRIGKAAIAEALAV